MEHNTWNIDPNKVDDALFQYVDDVGYEHALKAITLAIDTSELKETLEYIFRMEDYESAYFKEDEDENEEEYND